MSSVLGDLERGARNTPPGISTWVAAGTLGSCDAPLELPVPMVGAAAQQSAQSALFSSPNLCPRGEGVYPDEVLMLFLIFSERPSSVTCFL